jgi:hypothetical protein
VVLAYKPLELLALPFRNREPLVLAVLSQGQLLPASAALQPLVVLAYKLLEPLVGEPLPLAHINLKNLLVSRKNRNNSFLSVQVPRSLHRGDLGLF